MADQPFNVVLYQIGRKSEFVAPCRHHATLIHQVAVLVKPSSRGKGSILSF